MRIPSILAAAAFTLQASCFLIPFEVSGAADAASNQVWDSHRQIVELDCPGCALTSQDGNIDAENTIHLEFTIDDDSERLRINGETVFPFIKPFVPANLNAPQIRTSDGSATEVRHLGYALESLPPTHFPHESGEIFPLQFTVLDLDGVSVKVDTLKIDILRQADGISIAKLSNIPFEQTPGAAECRTSLCRLRAIVAARVRAMLEAARARAHAAGAWAKGGCRGKKHGMRPGFHPGQKAPPKGDHAHPHLRHGHRIGHRIGHVLHQTLRFFVIPALLGVIGGLIASAVGMMVGQALVFLWLRFVRGGQRGNIRLSEVAVGEDEKDALVEGDELPPQYEDVEEVVVVEDQKE